MSTFFALLSTIDPDLFIVQVQTLVAEFETPPLQVKWSVVSTVFVQRKGKQKVKEENSVGGNIEGDAIERIWLLWCSM